MDLATLNVRVEAGAAIRETEKLNAALGRTETASTKAQTAARALGTALGVTALAGVSGLGLGFRKLIRETSEAEAVQAQLRAGLLSTGGASRQTIDVLNQHAQALQRLTTFSDEAVGSAQSILLTFTKISGDTFPAATRAVLDMAARMGGDLNGAALQVGKALNAPTEGLTALTRAGVQFSDAQERTIKHLVATNQLVGAQSIILRELERQFGGSAEAARNTLGGALAHLTNQWGDLFEASEESSAGMVRAINGLADALPRIGQNIDTTVRGFQVLFGWTNKLAESLYIIERRPFTLGPDHGASAVAAMAALDAHANSTADAMRTLFGGGTAADPFADERQAWEESRARADRRAKWENEAIARAVQLAQARFAAENPTGPALGSLTLNSVRDKSSSRPTFGGAGLPAGGLTPTTPRMKSASGDAQFAAYEAAKAAMEQSAALAEQLTENFTRSVQGHFATLFRDIFAGGRSAFQNFLDGFKGAVLNTVAELASKRLMESVFGGASGVGGLGALLSSPLAIGAGVGALVFGAIGRRSGPSYRANNTPRYDANGMDARQVAAREWLAAQQGTNNAPVRASVAGVLTENTAARLFATFDAIRRATERGAAAAERMEARLAAGVGAASDLTIDRVLGARSQSLRLASGVAVVA